MSCFTTGELRDFLLRHHVATEDYMEKKDFIDLMMQRRRPSTSRHEEAQHVSPLRVCMYVCMYYVCMYVSIYVSMYLCNDVRTDKDFWSLPVKSVGSGAVVITERVGTVF